MNMTNRTTPPVKIHFIPLAFVIVCCGVAAWGFSRIEAAYPEAQTFLWGNVLGGAAFGLVVTLALNEWFGFLVVALLLALGSAGDPFAMDSWGSTGLKDLNASVGVAVGTLLAVGARVLRRRRA